MRHAVRNGRLIAEEEAVLPVTRREVFFNFSVYESLKVWKGRALFVQEHLDRLLDSARILELGHPFAAREIAAAIERLVEADELREATIKLLLLGGEEPLYIVYSDILPGYPVDYYREGASAITYRGERIIPKAKSNCLLLNYLAGREAARNDALEALLIDGNGKATEGTRSNLFAVRGKELLTAGEDVLYGVTRKHVLEIAERRGIPLRFEKIDGAAIIDGCYEELFITSTSMGAIPISMVNGRNILWRGGAGEPHFPTASLIHTELREAEEREAEG